jgi:hypothetical protein
LAVVVVAGFQVLMEMLAAQAVVVVGQLA